MNISVGTIFYSVWNQCRGHIDFYEVVASDQRCVSLRRLLSKVTDADGQRVATPCPGEYVDETFTRVVLDREEKHPSIFIDESTPERGLIWNGEPVFHSYC